jgi:hypothetical protein
MKDMFSSLPRAKEFTGAACALATNASGRFVEM